MVDTPLYAPRVEPSNGLGPTVQPASLPVPVSVAPVAAENPMAKEMQNLGKEVSAFGVKLSDSQDETRAANARTNFMTKIDELRGKYSEDSDFQNAEKNFTRDAIEAQTAELENISDPKRRAETRLHMQVQLLGGKREVQSAALSQESDTNVSEFITRWSSYGRDAATAPTPAARLVTLGAADADLDRMVTAGWISDVDGAKHKIQLRETIDDSDVRKLIEGNPRAGLAALEDPKQFPALSPARRQTLIEHAKNGNDKAVVGELGNRANWDPAGAALTVGVVSSPAQLNAIFERGILPTENATGDNSLVSNRGAVGVSQILPGTARDMLRSRGRDDLVKLDDTALSAELRKPENSSLNRQLGQDYFNLMGNRYGGNLPVAIAAYNAGPGRADKWVEKATAQFGPNFTAAEFSQVVDIAETRDYLAKVYKANGAAMDGGGLSRSGQLHAAATVGGSIDSANTQRVQAAKAVAEVARTGMDFSESFRNGVAPEPVAYATAIQANVQAAQYGDKTAAKWVAETLFQEKMAPVRDELYRMSPSHLTATVASMEDDQRARGASQRERDMLEVAKATLKDVQERGKSDPISLGERARIVGAPVMVDVKADPATPGFADALTARGVQGEVAQRYYNGEIKVLKPAEAEALKARYTQAGPEERFGILRAAGQALEPRALEAFVGQIGGNHDTSFAAMLASTRPDLARDVLRGTELLKSKEVSEKAALVRPAFASTMGGQLFPDPAMQKAVENAAIGLYVSRAGQNGTLYDSADTSAVEKAVEDVAGKIVKRNGTKTPITPFIEPGKFVGALDNLSQADLNLMGGAVDRTGKAVLPADISNYGVLKPLAPGSPYYVVGMKDPRARDGFAPLFNAGVADGSGGPLVFNMAVLASQTKTPTAYVASRYQQRRSDFRAGQAVRINDAARGQE